LDEEVDIGPHMSECIMSNTPLALLSLLRNGIFTLLPSAHRLHMPSWST
jgi:hypothetical protein